MRYSRFSSFLVTAVLAGGLALFVSCGGGSGPKKKPDSEPVDVPPWGVGGAGGAPPLYGEGDEVPSELRLRFKRLPLENSGGGTDMAFLPRAKEMLMTLREGSLYHVAVETDRIVPIRKWQFEEEIFTRHACGPTNVILDPDFTESGFIYVSYCVDEHVTRLVRYDFEPDVGPSNPSVIFETFIEDPVVEENWHRFGSMGWEEDGETLWMLVGDHFLRAEAQNVATLYGGVHRLIPNREPGGSGHAVPSGNMLDLGVLGRDGATPVPTLFAYGLRSPWRGTRDVRGRTFIGDVGLGAFEEVNLLTEVGQNFGWDDSEGPCTSDCEGLVDPIAAYTRRDDDPYISDDPDTIEASLRAIWVGEIYERPSVDRYHGLMDGVVPFGDLFTGWVRGIRVDEDGVVMMNRSIGNLQNITQWRVAPDGYVYVLDLDGQIHVALLDVGE